MFTQSFIQAQIKGNIKAPHHWPLWGEFPAQRASDAKNVSIWWRHHVPSYKHPRGAFQNPTRRLIVESSTKPLKLEQDSHLFAYNIFKHVFLYEAVLVVIKIPPKNVPKRPLYMETKGRQISTGRYRHRLYFNKHVSGYYLKAERKLNALSHISRHRNLNSKSFIYNDFIVSNCNWCPLVWYFSDTANSSKLENCENSLSILAQIAH